MMKTICPPLKTLCTVLLLGVSFVLAAQEEQTGTALSRELTLEREYNPSVQDANKVNTLPEVKEPEITPFPADYATLSLPADLEREIGLLPAARVLQDMKYNQRRGYANIGGGNYLNINGDLGYHILSTDKDRLAVFFSHRSTAGKLKYTEGYLKDEKVDAKVNDNLGGFDYRHEFDHSLLHLKATYGYSAFNYYGMSAPNVHAVWPAPVADTETNQISQRLTLNAGLESKNAKRIGYVLDFDHTRFSYKYAWDNSMKGIAEYSAGATMKLYTTWGADKQLGVATRLDYFFYTLPALSTANFDNHLEGTITPYYQSEGDFWNFMLGVNIMFVTPEGENSTKLFASPNAGIDVRLGTNSVAYINVKGEIHSNSASQLSRENRYIDPYTGVTSSRTWLDVAAGVKSGILPGFWFHLFGEYKITDDDYFFIPYLTQEGFGNVSRVLPIDSKLLRGGVELKYTYRRLFDLVLKGIYNHWNEEEDDLDYRLSTNDFQLTPKRKAYGRPSTELMAGVNIRPIEKLSLALDYHLVSGRKTLLYNNNREMKDISELNLTASYTFNDTFGAYLNMKNLLFKSYELIYGYPLQGFSIMAGVNIHF
ncbi:MAG: TonB-dependent receptor [Tannerellaceae bacterium]|nr:TonB-dependent receptor [Tannerellaceae bacterium]